MNAIERLLTTIPDLAFREGAGQLFLLDRDRQVPFSGIGRRGAFIWWEMSLAEWQSDGTGAAPPVAAEAALFAGAHASPEAARYLAGRLLALDPIPSGRRAVFAVLYFAFSAAGVVFADRCGIAARFATRIADCRFDRYLRFQIARAVDADLSTDHMFAGLHSLSGIEILKSCGEIVDEICHAIGDRIEHGDTGRDVPMPHDKRRYADRMLARLLKYLRDEAENAREEYARAERSKPPGVPYFVREHTLSCFCDDLLDLLFSAQAVFALLEKFNWYHAEQFGLHQRIAAEMRREANLAFGRWYRYGRNRRQQGAIIRRDIAR